MQYRKEIDGLRAIAVLAVIFYHANFKYFSGGFVGVDIFFVISGYLITSIIVTEKREGRFTFIKFYERRLRRILPALFFVMIVCLPLAWLWLLPKEMLDFSKSVIAVSVFSSNIYYWFTSGYFDVVSEFKPLLHTWSLAVEEQYYLVFPVFLLFMLRLEKKWQLLILLIGAFVSFQLAQWGSLRHRGATFYLLPTRSWEFLIGTFMSFIIVSQKVNFNRYISEIGGFIGVVLITYSIFFFDSKVPYPSIYTLAPTLGAALLIVFTVEQTIVSRILASKVLVGIGLISYSTYLWHWPLLVFARQRSLNKPEQILVISLVFITMGLGYLTWKYIESPFRQKKYFSRGTIFLFSGSAVSVMFVLGLTGYQMEGYRERFSPEILVLNDGASDKNSRQEECHTGGNLFMSPAKACSLGSNKNIVGALIGDSHADSISSSFSQLLSLKNMGVKQMTYGGCAPSKNFFRGGEFRCVEYNTHVNTILNNSKYTNVIVMARWTMYLEGTGFDNGEGGIEPDIGYFWTDGGINHIDTNRTASERKIAVAESFKNAIYDLLKGGKKVFLIYPVPEVGWNVPIYASKKALYTNVSMVTTSYKKYLERNAAAIEVLDSIGENDNLIRIYPEKILCNTYIIGRCIAVLNGVPLYYDNNHLSNAGSRLIAEEIVKYIG